MPTRNVNLTEELDRFVASRVQSGRYANAREVVRSAPRLLERDEREYEEKMAALRAPIQESLDSGNAEPQPSRQLFAETRRRIRSSGQNIFDRQGCDFIRSGLRREIESHVVFYRVEKSENRVLRILHQRMLPVQSRFES